MFIELIISTRVMNSPVTVCVMWIYVTVHEIVKTFITSGQRKFKARKKQKPLYLEQNLRLPLVNYRNQSAEIF